MENSATYVNVILPLRLSGTLTYRAPEEIKTGSWVKVKIRNYDAFGVVEKVFHSLPEGMDENRIKEVEPIGEMVPVGTDEIKFWKAMAEYYMCSVGEVFKAACSADLKKAEEKRKRASEESAGQSSSVRPSDLSQAQEEAAKRIRDGFAEGRTVLLHGITGSGKTEIYMNLAAEQLQKGGSVLILVPEIAISRQLQHRFEKVFGEKLIVFHSKQTIASRKRAVARLRSSSQPAIVLGTRSAVFLPFHKLGLVIVDEEHDHSYKQEDPAPRYNGRDTAIILGTQRKADILLGSATPSLESLYNAASGKYCRVVLDKKYYDSPAPVVEIIDTNKERRLKNMQGSFSRGLLKQIRATLECGEQVMVFRSRRAYSPIVQCGECGAIPKCPRCNVNLSYHKFNNTLSCHYCGWSKTFSSYCKECGEPALTDRGAGTEKIEEELKAIFPDKTIARFDADTTANRTAEEKIIREFAAGEIDILVGTQMITKGFDFEKLSLVAIINADSIFAVQDFRSDEKAVQLLRQLLGRAGRREKPGRLVIQTAQSDHPVILAAQNAEAISDSAAALEERKIFRYPPYVRLIRIIVKDRQEGRLWNVCRHIATAIKESGIADASGPVTPSMETVDRYHIREFWIKLERDGKLSAIKKALLRKTELIEKEFKGGPSIVLDVDPL